LILAAAIFKTLSEQSDLLAFKKDKNMYRVVKLTNGQHRSDERLLKEMQNLVTPSYADSCDPLAKEVQFCDTCFLAYDDAVLVGFFMTRHYAIQRAGQTFLTVYLGLSAIAQHLKGTVAVRLLYGACLTDLAQVDTSSFDGSFLWGTTANPTVFVAASRYLNGIQPNSDGTFGESNLYALELLKEEFAGWGWQTKSSPQHPYVLCGVATARYSFERRQRMSKFTRRFTLFDDLGIDESNGDRLIFVAQFPNAFHQAAFEGQASPETRSLVQ